MRWPLVAVPAVLAGFTALTACSPGASVITPADAPQTSPGVITVTANDDACQLSRTETLAGRVIFDVRNAGREVTEFYVYDKNSHIVGEAENIRAGQSRRLIIEVPDGGNYQTRCKSGVQGKSIRTDFIVTGGASKAADTELDSAVASYRRYVSDQADQLVARTGQFVAAVKSSDVERAKALYPQARAPWERIEPVAEKLGELDPRIDARENDVTQGEAWTGYHRLEKDLWVDGLKPDSAAIADQLDRDGREVAEKARGIDLTAVDLANGAKELLDEVARSKVTGEEDRYSHTDLADFRNNVEGSKAAIDALRLSLARRDAALLSTLDERFAAVTALLDRYRSGDGYVAYTQLTPDQVKVLAASVDALSEPLSKAAGVVTT
jgi:iron uptake system component EfeO